MSYQEQLQYLRQKYGVEAEKVNEQSTPAWEEVDEETEQRLKERQNKDKWIEDAGMSPIFESADPLTTAGGRARMEDFDSKFSNDPMVQKYGQSLFDAVNQMVAEVQNPNTPFDNNQATEMLKQMIASMRQEAMNGGK